MEEEKKIYEIIIGCNRQITFDEYLCEWLSNESRSRDTVVY